MGWRHMRLFGRRVLVGLEILAGATAGASFMANMER